VAEIELDDTALRLACVAVEDVLIDYRDRRISMLGAANGFVVNERDGSPSEVMRLRTRDGLRIAIRAYLEAMEGTAEDRTRAMREAAERVGAVLPAEQGEEGAR
jgi:hypothetical protein